MKSCFISAFIFTSLAISSHADPVYRFFELRDKDRIATVAFWQDGEEVFGTHYTGEPDGEGAYGTLYGVVEKNGLLHVTFNFVTHERRQSEEQLMMLKGGRLIIGEGELEEHGPGQLTLKDRKKVVFANKSLAEVKMEEFDAADAKAAPITSIMSATLEKTAGVSATILGEVRITGGWARVNGNVQVPEGKTVKDAELATRLAEQSLRAYFKQDKQGHWKLMRYGFIAADGIVDYEGEGAEKQDEAPWPLDEEFDEE